MNYVSAFFFFLVKKVPPSQTVTLYTDLLTSLSKWRLSTLIDFNLENRAKQSGVDLNI